MLVAGERWRCSSSSLVDVALAVDPRRLEVERDLPAGHRPAAATGELTLAGPQPDRPHACASRSPTSWPRRCAPATRRLRGTVPGRGDACARTATLRPSRRGRFEVGEVVAARRGPARPRRPPAAACRCPACSGSTRRSRAARRPSCASPGPASSRSGCARRKGRGGGTEFDQLREYGVDDEVRRIDWAATARAGKAMVRTYRAERNQNVLLLLDNGRVMAGQVADVPRVEHAMDARACASPPSPPASATGAGWSPSTATVRAVLPARAGRDQLGRVTEAMFDLEPVLVESDYRGAFTHALARFRRRSLIVLFTDLVEQAVGESLLPALPLLVRHHIVLVAAVRDPDVVALGHRGAGRRRRRLPRRRRHARPRRARPRHRPPPRPRRHRRRRPARPARPPLADTYLDLKARGGL